MKNHKADILVALICLAGFIIYFIAFSPGFMSPDTFEQYGQSLSHHYNTWHPPMMAFLWSQLNYIRQGPQVMLAFQLTILWTSAYFFATAISKRQWRAGVLLVFFFAPFIHNFSGYIIKDVQMAFSWTLALSLLFRCTVQKRLPTKTEAIVSVLFLFYGASLRHNAITALLPLCFLWASVVFMGLRKILLLAMTIAFFFLIIVTNTFVSKALTPEEGHPENVSYMYDLTGLFITAGENVFPMSFYSNPKFDTSYLRRQFTFASYDHIWWDSSNRPLLRDDNIDHSPELRRAWIKAITQNPTTYLQNRIRGILYFLRIKTGTPHFTNFYYVIFPDPNIYGFKRDDHKFLFRWVTQYVEAQAELGYLQPWFWLLLNIVLFVFARSIKSAQLKQFFMGVLLAGLLYIIPMLFLMTTDADFRYFYWECIACVIAVMVLLADRQIPAKQATH